MPAGSTETTSRPWVTARTTIRLPAGPESNAAGAVALGLGVAAMLGLALGLVAVVATGLALGMPVGTMLGGVDPTGVVVRGLRVTMTANAITAATGTIAAKASRGYIVRLLSEVLATARR